MNKCSGHLFYFWGIACEKMFAKYALEIVNFNALFLFLLGMLFSLPFLLLTFFVYGFIPELRNLHGKSLMCYVFGLSVLYISLSFVQLHAGKAVDPSACLVAGYMIYISVLLCFFWLNVMCYDIWSTFR